MHSRKQGNGLILVLIVITAIAFGLYSVSDLVNSEFRLNKKNEAYIEAKQAAESLVQNAIADLEARFRISGKFSEDLLSSERNPLSIGQDFLNFHNSDANKSNLVAQDTEVIGGRVFFDSDNTVWAVEVFGKATVKHPALGRVTAYASQILEIEATFLFDFAIFYNMPMEIAPGKEMLVVDKVHVNGDAHVQSTNGLTFDGLVTIAGDIIHGRNPRSNKTDKREGSVNFKDQSGNLISLENNDLWPESVRNAFSGSESSGNWLDSTVTNFANFANQIWGGSLSSTDHGLLTQDHGVETLTLPGISEYVEDDPSTAEDETNNSGYSIIQPAKSNELTEKNKFAYKAGLTIEVAQDGALSYFTYARNTTTNEIETNADGSLKKIRLTPTTEFASKVPYVEADDGTVASGLFDHRQQEQMNLVNIDVGVLAGLLHKANGDGKNGTDWGDPANKPNEWWNGIVYVQYPTENTGRADNVTPANRTDWAVKLVNGETIPNPNFAREKDIFGTTIATNLPMYVQGNYNSDGVQSKDSSTSPDTLDGISYKEQGGEAPASLAADAITFLSTGWQDTNSKKNIDGRIAQSTEVSAAILTGLVPSGKLGDGKSASGGVENFPRFMESWGSENTFSMRGSIVAMFESEVAKKPWLSKKEAEALGGEKVYRAPKRNWGFHKEYAGGNGPPGGPFAPSFSTRDLRILSQEEYEERIQANWP